MALRTRLARCLVVLCLAGCGPELPGEGELGAGSSALTVGNGGNLNGGNLNGPALNGTLTSVELAGSSAGTLSLAGSSLTGAAAGTQLVGTLGSGTTVALRIDQVHGPAAGSDVWTYDVSLQKHSGAWAPLCVSAAGTAVASIALADRWNFQSHAPGVGGARIPDAARFTFACEGAALAKCVRAGYRPWVSAAMAAQHQSCTRLMRGDYCGDGTAHTTDGNWVNLYDAAGVQVDTEAWRFEAEWDEAGARCVTAATRAPSPFLCLPTRPVLPGCGTLSHFSSGAVLMSEIP